MKIRMNLKKTIISLFSIIVIVVVYASWWVSGFIIDRPMGSRVDYCKSDPHYCPIKRLEKLRLSQDKIDVKITSFDGTQLRGIYLPSKNRAAVIVQHGYGGNYATVLHIANMLYKKGYGVIAMDLRAHGTSGGDKVTFGRDEAKDMQFVFDYLKTRPDVDPEKIGLYGWSLGAATVLLHGAMNPEVKAVVADSAYDAINAQNIQAFTDTIWPMPDLITYFCSVRADVNFDKESPIVHSQIYKTKPLLLLIAGDDHVIDPNSGERLLKAINSDHVKVWREATFDHVRFSYDAAEKFSTEVINFFNKYLKPES